MTLVVVRHAESVENANKYQDFYRDPRPYDGTTAHHLSHRIVGLTPKGFRQAVWLGEELTERFGANLHVFTSTYRRAIDTATIAFPEMDGISLEATSLLDEQHYGHATYMSKAELFTRYPSMKITRIERKHEWIPPGGESLSDGVWKRATEFLNLVYPGLESNQQIIAITHHTTVLALRALLENRSLLDLVTEARIKKTPNAGIFYYTGSSGELKLVDITAPPV